MNEITAVIVDDEPIARARIRRFLSEDKEIKIVAECEDGFQALSAVKDLNPDLIFLDVQMPGKTGFGFLKEIRQAPLPVTIFTTAFEQYALEAFEVQALDYLLKPIDRERFRKTLERAKIRIEREREALQKQARASTIQPPASQAEHFGRLVIKSGGHTVFLKINEIEWVKSLGNYVEIHRRSSKYLLHQSLSSLEKQLNPQKFIRIHRTTIVNTDFVEEILSSHGSYPVVLNDGTKLILSRRFGLKLRKKLAGFFKEFF